MLTVLNSIDKKQDMVSEQPKHMSDLLYACSLTAIFNNADLIIYLSSLMFSLSYSDAHSTIPGKR